MKRGAVEWSRRRSLEPLKDGKVTGWQRRRTRAASTVSPFSASTLQRPINSPSNFRVRPDFAFPTLRVAVFVDGCFWHACPLHATRPKHRAAFWRQKLAANVARDWKVNRALRAAGWRVLRIWEHALARRQEARLARRIRRFLDVSAVRG